jgi:hypothetical protein
LDPIFAPNINAPNIIKQILLDIKLQITPNIIIVGDQYSTLTNKSSRQNNKGNLRTKGHCRSNRLNIIFYPTATKYTFFSEAYGIFSKSRLYFRLQSMS